MTPSLPIPDDAPSSYCLMSSCRIPLALKTTMERGEESALSLASPRSPETVPPHVSPGAGKKHSRSSWERRQMADKELSAACQLIIRQVSCHAVNFLFPLWCFLPRLTHQRVTGIVNPFFSYTGVVYDLKDFNSLYLNLNLKVWEAPEVKFLVILCTCI